MLGFMFPQQVCMEGSLKGSFKIPAKDTTQRAQYPLIKEYSLNHNMPLVI